MKAHPSVRWHLFWKSNSLCNFCDLNSFVQYLTLVGFRQSEEGASPPTASVIWIRLQDVLLLLLPRFYVAVSLDRKFTSQALGAQCFCQVVMQCNGTYNSSLFTFSHMVLLLSAVM